MEPLSGAMAEQIRDVARRHGVSEEAALVVFRALERGNGSAAQFQHPELGGAGQWMRGGMTMVGNLFDSALKAKVAGLCEDLARLLEKQPERQPAGGGGWWPAELGTPNASGGQGRCRYAWFAGPRRLVVEVEGGVRVYDTLHHRIGGVSQAGQAGAGSLTLTSQEGVVRVEDLPLVGESQNPPGPAPG